MNVYHCKGRKKVLSSELIHGKEIKVVHSQFICFMSDIEAVYLSIMYFGCLVFPRSLLIFSLYSASTL